MYPEHLIWVSASRKMSAALKKHLCDNCRANGKKTALQRLIPRGEFRVPVIVQMEGKNYDQDLVRMTAGHRDLTFNHHLPLIKSFAATAGLEALKKLDGNQAVRRIWLDRPVHTNLDIAVPAVEGNAAWKQGYSGKGVVVAVVDTGIHPHPDLVRPTSRIVAFHDLVGGRRVPYDDNGHGTHCAGIIAGNGRSLRGRYRGIAPEAGLVGVKALDKDGGGLLSTVIAGIDWCLAQKDALKIRVISLSLGSPATASYRDDPVAIAVGTAWAAGLVVVAAAGNDGPAGRTVESPGYSPAVITVGAEDDHRTIPPDDDTIASFSSRGPTRDGLAKPDVVAPGVGIVSLRTPGSVLDRNNPRFRVARYYFSLSGTSMATPMCAGLAALILEAKPELTPDQVKGAITHSCRDLRFDRPDQGNGLLDARDAVGTSRVVY
ncbi:MAG TPA: S8 family peptidase [Spirochaetia bacterium]|nr:S8 family peptidase [Spirochaetia bacterium]